MSDQLKHCCQNMESQPVSTKTEASPTFLKLDPQRQGRALRHGLSTTWEASDMWVTVLTPSRFLSASIYHSLWRNVSSEETQWQEQVRQGTVHEGAPDPVKQQGAVSQVGNYRWIPSGQKPAQQTLKKHQDHRGDSVCHQWAGLKIVLQIYHSSPLANDI